MPSLSSVPKYRDFINERDKALERMLRNTHKRMSDLTKSALDGVVTSVMLRYRGINDHTRFTTKGRASLDALYADLDHQFRYLTHLLVPVIERLRRASTTLAYAGELEATCRVLGISREARSITHVGDRIEPKVYAALTKLLGRVRTAVEQGYAQGQSLDEVVRSVERTFPKVVGYKVPPRELKPLKEAFAPEWADDATVDFISDDDWRNVVSLYKEEYVPKNRKLTFDVDVGEPELEEWYGWEIEQDVTADFLARVRDGSVEAANQAGVTDFMWVSVIDDKTRPEHRLKNGLTSSEIEAKLSGEWQDFDDTATVAPSGMHRFSGYDDPNCRCRSTPYVADLPEVDAVDYKDFDTWLNT